MNTLISEVWFGLIDQAIELEEVNKTYFTEEMFYKLRKEEIHEKCVEECKQCPKCKIVMERYRRDDEFGYRCSQCRYQGIRIIRPPGMNSIKVA